ncbi:hypothetical protein DAI22_03g115200 [Oryza sativa Japonica Group]|nr:hypothetical protein DAI22_03g115200 [Oryza sativa Japonica Group]
MQIDYTAFWKKRGFVVGSGSRGAQPEASLFSFCLVEFRLRIKPIHHLWSGGLEQSTDTGAQIAVEVPIIGRNRGHCCHTA